MNQNLVEPPTPARLLPIRFTASGSEYFRIWIVNLLLMIGTLGLYMPFAKARQLRYFHENTLVDGFPLAFHGDPWRMLRGYLLVGGVALAYTVVSPLWPLVGFGLMLLLALAWPWLMRSSLRFRLGQTSWRGLRMRFEGSVADAYRVFWPIAIPLVATLVALVLVLVLAEATPASDDPMQVAEPWLPPWLPLGVGIFATVSIVPLIYWRLKRYQHNHYVLVDQHTRLAGVRGWDLYKVALKCMFVVFAPAPLTGPYLIGRLQDLIWGHTRSEHVQFHSRLSVSSLFWLTLKNSLLTTITLGLYWPFAVVATTRLRLAAMSIEVSRPVEALIGEARDAAADATGEAAGDLLGFDVAL